jgi:hypothetical protein
MADLYGRSWTLTAGVYQWSDLRVVFEVKRNLNRHPDPAQITVYNLSRAHRAAFSQGDPIVLVGGYTGAAGMIFSGQLMELSVQRDGTEWATTFVCRDGDAAWKSYISTGFNASTPLTTAVQYIASRMGLTVAQSSLAQLSGISTQGRLAHVGLAPDAMSKLLEPRGFRWLLQDGALVIIPNDGSTYEDAVVLSPQTGLIGSPEPMTDKKIKGKTQTFHRLRLNALLQPSLTPGRKLQLVSEQYTGIYRVDAVVHRGDSRGQDWYSMVEVTRLPIEVPQ